MSEADRTDKESVELANEILRDFGISFSEAETNFKTSENFRKEFIDMTNKTSDKNVANIEDDVDELKSIMNLRTVSGFAYSQKNTLSLQKAIKNVLADYTRQKEMNEEHQKINGELIERIQKLEEKLLDMINGTEIINKETPEYIKENYIPKQAVIDKIDELKLSGGSNGKDNVENLVRELAIDILQELLEGERK